LAACQRKRLRFLRISFTQRTQRKRLRLNGNRALYSLNVGGVGNFRLKSGNYRRHLRLQRKTGFKTLGIVGPVVTHCRIYASGQTC